VIGQDDNVGSGKITGGFLVGHVSINERNFFPVWGCSDQLGRKMPVFPGFAYHREPEVRMGEAQQIEGHDKVF
jgi:hypothetical protein